MRQIVYLSDAAKGLSKQDLKRILTTAQSRNAQNNLSGALYLKKRQFVQILEGPEIALKETLEKIKSDPRHTNFRLRLDREINQRAFGNWTMMLIGDEPEIKSIINCFWPDGLFDPQKVTGEDLFEFLNIACNPRARA